MRIITQMTDRMAGHDADAYNSSGNEAWNGASDNPGYAGKAYTANLYVSSKPIHGWAQYDVGGFGGSDSYRNEYDKGYTGAWNTRVAYERVTNADADASGNGRFGAHVFSDNVFANRPYPGSVRLNSAFVEPRAGDSDALRTSDADPAQLTVSGLANATGHTADITVTVDFMTHGSDGSGAAGSNSPTRRR